MTAKFTACCSGFPKPDCQWFKDDVLLLPSSRFKIDSENNGLLRLTISGVQEKDVGVYRLRISNIHGEDECSARLICDGKLNLFTAVFGILKKEKSSRATKIYFSSRKKIEKVNAK